LELVLARAVERHVFRLGGSDLSFWMRNPFEGFKWQLVHRLDLRRNRLTGDPLASLTLRSHVRPLSSSSVVPAKGWSWPILLKNAAVEQGNSPADSVRISLNSNFVSVVRSWESFLQATLAQLAAV
jgi:hypothetical protein